MNISADVRQGHVVLIGRASCETPEQLLRSDVFRRVLWRYLRHLSRYDSPLLSCVKPFYLDEREDEPIKEQYDLEAIRELFLALVDAPANEVVKADAKYALALQDIGQMMEFVEGFYDFWRRQERFLIYYERKNLPLELDERHRRFVEINRGLKGLVLHVYRTISANLSGRIPRVYRQLPAGAGAGLLVERLAWDNPGQVYQQLGKIPFIQLAVIEPPLVYYPKRNKRQGHFQKVDHNPLRSGMIKDAAEWVCYPAKVGDLLIFIYFHIDFMSLGTSMLNLFDVAGEEEIVGKKPDAVLVFGVDPEELGDKQTVYYHDDETGMVVGAIGNSEDVDYFGYFKKMVLTMHNSIMIDRGYLPIHGAMASIHLRSGRQVNVVLVGDSGAGKSESLEAFRVLGDEYIRQLTIIFDDMGSLRIKDGQVCGYGSEIGAFVRLDDLEPGFAYEEIDRSIFMNPHRTNARLVIPITDYREIVKGYPVDLLLYANNYEPVSEADDRPFLEFFASPDDALPVFRQGARISKGTTDEKGLVQTYFANPFGAPQKKQEHDRIARQFFEFMFEKGVKVGQLRTQLGIDGKETTGPENAAKALFDFVNR